MKTRPSRIISPSGKVLAGQLLLLLFVLPSAPALMGESGNPSAKPADLQKPTSAPQVVTANGLQTVAFDTLNGSVIVNLPDDMMAGDTISGTVVAAPKGQTEEERTQNAAELSKLKALISLKPLAKNTGKPEAVEPEIGFRFQELTPIDCCLPAHTSRIIERFNFSLPQSSGSQTYPLYLTLGQPNAPLTEVETVLITVSRPILFVNDQARPAAPSRPTSTTSSNNFFLPVLGQQGLPIVIFGPFDGNSSNTTLNSAGLRSTVQDFEKNTENVSGGFGLLAESPRKAVFSNPQNVVGPIQITLKEGNKQTTGNYRNVGVNLSAPKTNLLKGESTTLTVEVTGLQGITKPAPLTLESRGVITMEGGSFQPLVIQPSQVSGDGSYTTTRGITGVQTGGWTATATVVTQPFNIVLRDPSPPQTILVNSFTGDYVFCGSGFKLSGLGEIKRNGCVLTLTDVKPDRRINGTFDGCVPVFSPAGKNTDVVVTVIDTQPLKRRIYFNPLNRPMPPVQDVSAFATCP